MKTMIDTNILYCLSGINEDEKISSELLSVEMEKYKPFVISELSLLELFTHFGFDNENIKKVLQFIEDNKIHFINFFPLSSSILNNFMVDYSSDLSIDSMRKRALANKINIESETLPLVIVASIVVLALYYDSKTADLDAKIKLSMHLVSLVDSNIDYIKEGCRETVENFYKTHDGTQFKDEVKTYILMFLYILTINYALSENGKLLNDIDLEDITDEDVGIIQSKNSSSFKNILVKKIRSKNNRGLLCQKMFWDDLDDSLSIFFTSLKTEFNPGMINYYSLYIRKMFIEDFKFEKNNLIDSQFHEYSETYEVFTLDELLTESYRNIQPDKYDLLRGIQERIKIKP